MTAIRRLVFQRRQLDEIQQTIPDFRAPEEGKSLAKAKPTRTGSHVMEFPRLASFIATSNMKDILSDPSGNRRFSYENCRIPYIPSVTAIGHTSIYTGSILGLNFSVDFIPAGMAALYTSPRGDI